MCNNYLLLRKRVLVISFLRSPRAVGSAFDVGKTTPCIIDESVGLLSKRLDVLLPEGD